MRNSASGPLLLSAPTTASTESLDERLHRADTDRRSLLLHVNILSSQVDEQNAKINDLELDLHQGHSHLVRTEDLLNAVSISQHAVMKPY